MISWNASAELNKCTIEELKARFHRFPKSTKKVVAVCDQCGEERVVRFYNMGDLCHACAARSPKTRAKQRKAAIGRKATPKARAKQRKAATGRKVTPETRDKHRKTMMGNTRNLGKKLPTRSAEHMQHISATRQGIPYDEWESFACEKKYCPKFNDACRESNREKYGMRCFICGKSEKANEQKLSVHHVDMDKAQGCESNWKLVPLCKHCHATAHNDEIVARLGYMVKDS